MTTLVFLILLLHHAGYAWSESMLIALGIMAFDVLLRIVGELIRERRLPENPPWEWVGVPKNLKKEQVIEGNYSYLED